MEQGKPVEFPMAAILLSGKKGPINWGEKASVSDFFDLKGLTENLLAGLHMPEISFANAKHPTFHPGRQADIMVNGIRLGSLGEVHPSILAMFDIKQKVYYTEINAHYLQANRLPPPKMKPLAQFPASERDETFVMSKTTPISLVKQAVQSLPTPLLEQFQFTDLYDSELTRNATFRFTYRDRSKTISLEEVKAAHDALVEHILKETNGLCTRQPLP
jgi:phenylalanyl-tRNA synthetase beta chain